MSKKIRLTRSERIAIFRPNVMLQRLDRQEANFVSAAMPYVRMQAESLAIQYQQGIKPRNLTLNALNVRSIAKELSRSMIDTYAMGEVSIQNELQQAELIHQEKLNGTYQSPIVPFAAMKEDELDPGNMPFYPTDGVDWYDNYTLRLAGVHSVDALEHVKDAIIQGVENGLNQEETVNLIRSIFPQFSEHRLENIARTETAKIYEQARYQTMSGDDEIIGYEFAAIMDTRTSDICRSRDGRKIHKGEEEGWIPPLHYQCRSVLLPIFAWEDTQWSLFEHVTPAMKGFGSSQMVIPESARNKIFIAGIPELRKNLN